MNRASRVGLAILGLFAVGCDKTGEDIPSACVGVDDIFQDAACLEALATQCRAIETEADCWAATPNAVSPTIHCAWTKVAVVADPQTCEIAETFGRCEAAEQGHGDGLVSEPCTPSGEFSEPAHTAFLQALELVNGYPYWNSHYYYAPVGPWWLDGTAASCGPNGDPLAPDWCSCGPAACLATVD